MNLFSGLLGEQQMSIHIRIKYNEGSDWVSLQTTGPVVDEIRRTGTWANQRVVLLKYPDGRIWDFANKTWVKTQHQ